MTIPKSMNKCKLKDDTMNESELQRVYIYSMYPTDTEMTT